MTPPPTNPSKTHSITKTPSLPPSFFHFSPLLFYFIYSPFLLPSHIFKPLVTFLLTVSMPPLSKTTPLHHPTTPFERDTLSLSLTLLLSLKETTFYRLISGPEFTSSPNSTLFLFSLYWGLLFYIPSQGASFFFLFGTTSFVCVFPCLSFSPIILFLFFFFFFTSSNLTFTFQFKKYQHILITHLYSYYSSSITLFSDNMHHNATMILSFYSNTFHNSLFKTFYVRG